MRRTREIDITSITDNVRRFATVEATDSSFNPSRDRLQTIAADYSFEQTFSGTFDANGQLHCETGPAVKPDGKGEPKFFWHGVEVPDYVVMAPSTINVKEIDACRNAEVQRVMIERYGMTRYFQDCRATLIAKDSFGELYEKRMAPNWGQPWRFVRVKNSTPEPDGTIKEYCLRVPPDITSAQAGIAWTFGLDGEDYQPEIET